MAADFHPTGNPTGRPTTEAVDPPNTTTNTEKIISKPQTRRIKRSLLLETVSYNETLISPSFSNSQPGNEVDDPRHITTEVTNMQPEFPPGVANDTPQQDESRSYPTYQASEYPSKNHTDRGTLHPLSSLDRQSENEVEEPRPTETATTNKRAESRSGEVNDTPTQDEPQSYPKAQIAEYIDKIE